MDSPKELGWFFSLPLCPHAKPNESIWIAKDMPVGEATKVLSKTPASIAADRQTKGKVADLGSIIHVYVYIYAFAMCQTLSFALECSLY